MTGVPGRVAVFASGGGSNFQTLIDRFSRDGSSARLVGLVASRETAGAIERAERAGIPVAVLPAEARDDPGREGAFLLETLEGWSAGCVVLAGYLRRVPEQVVRAYWGRMLNVHPALLPAFGGQGMYGSRVHRAVVESGVRVTGVTVHFVDEAYDRGPIIAQWPVPVFADDDPAGVAARVLEAEHALLPAVVERVAAGAVRLGPDGRVTGETTWCAGRHFGPADTPEGMEREGKGTNADRSG